MMTNAPFILNLDCDMHVNNPKIALHALCILLDSKGEKEVAFVQCPQQFYDGLKDDPFGNQLVALFVVSEIFLFGNICMKLKTLMLVYKETFFGNNFFNYFVQYSTWGEDLEDFKGCYTQEQIASIEEK